MPKTPKLMASAGSADDVEAAFYDALQKGDVEQLMACWADEDDIVCVHPGGGRLLGAGAVRASFEALFANGTVRAQPERIHRVETMAACVHSLVERIDILTPEGQAQAYVHATNVYHKTMLGWRMVAHHASPGMPAPEDASAPATLLH